MSLREELASVGLNRLDTIHATRPKRLHIALRHGQACRIPPAGSTGKRDAQVIFTQLRLSTLNVPVPVISVRSPDQIRPRTV